MLLQLLGVLTVILGIRQTRKLFRRPTLTSILGQWFHRRPRLKPHTFEVKVVASDTEATFSGNFETFTKARLDAPLEQRVKVLEEKIKYLKELVDRSQKELKQEMYKITNSLSEERNIRTAEDQKILSKLETTETGGLHISAMGAIWIFIGIVLSSLPKELSDWLS